MTSSATWEEKLADLQTHLERYDKLAVAFSAGVDSTFLLAVAHDVLGENVCAVTGISPTFPEREREEARAFCEKLGVQQILVETHEFDIPGFDHNPENRCYLCKRELFSTVVDLAEEQGLGQVVDGSNVDDLGDYRPGRKALEELQIASPLLACGFTKQDIRDASKAMGLPTWEKQSFACLASRFAYGDEITAARLDMVDEAEQALLNLGFSTVRVRVNGDEARIEIKPEEFDMLMGKREDIIAQIKSAGFTYVSLDLTGYRTGSMNETRHQ